MHEYALADAVLRAALRVAGERDLERVTRLEVGVGELQQISRPLFERSLSAASSIDDDRLEGLRPTVVIEPAQLRCRRCATDFSMAEAAGERKADDLEAIHFVPELAHAFLGCPGCESPDFEIVGGRGVTILAMEGIAGAERGDAHEAS